MAAEDSDEHVAAGLVDEEGPSPGNACGHGGDADTEGEEEEEAAVAACAAAAAPVILAAAAAGDPSSSTHAWLF